MSAITDAVCEAFSRSQIQASPLNTYPSSLLHNIDLPLSERPLTPVPRSREKPDTSFLSEKSGSAKK